eukprot:403361602
MDQEIYKENKIIQQQKHKQSKQRNQCKLTFENLNYEIKVKIGQLQSNKNDQIDLKQENELNGQDFNERNVKIIKNCSGYALPGESTYIMGSSGAGKTSLLNLISDRIDQTKNNHIKRKVLINNSIELTHKNFGQFSSYVMQDDFLFYQFTPRQALRFAARMKLQESIEQQDQRIEELLMNLELLSAADTMIGNQRFKSLSGGERKRTAIGVELITDPSMIILDEPSSGLDSFKATQICKLLSKIAKQGGKTIISTIHQPSSESFRYFDSLILMCDGNIVYQGLAKQSTQYFGKHGINCPRFANPADFFIRVLTINYPKEQNDQKKIQYLTKAYKQELLPLIYEQFSQKHSDQLPHESEILDNDSDKLMNQNSQHLNSFWKQLKLLLHRGFISLTGCMYFMLGYIVFTMINTTIMTFHDERSVFLREHSNGMYSIKAYFLAKTILDIPQMTFIPLLFSLITYFGIGLTVTASQFFYFYLILFLVTMCSASYGYFLSICFKREEDAVGAVSLIFLIVSMFGGFLANSSNYPDWIGWFQYLSPIRYGMEALVRNEFGQRTYQLNEVDFVQYLGYNVGFWQCLIILLFYVIFLRILAMICLKLLMKPIQ